MSDATPRLAKDGISHVTRCNCPPCKLKKKEFNKAYSKAHWEKNKAAITEKRNNRTPEEKEAHAQYLRDYRQEHKEDLSEKAKIFREENAERINAQRLEFRQNNRERLAADTKRYYETHKEERLAYAKHFRDEKMAPYYKIWDAIVQRTSNPNYHNFKYWGRRGIHIYEPWKKSYKEFEAYINSHLGERPSPEHSIDRFPNLNGNYEPGNIRWATALEQGNNRRDNKEYRQSISDDSPIYYTDGTLITLKEFAEAVNMPLIVAKYRYAMNWDSEWILSKDERGRKYTYGPHTYTIPELSAISGIDTSTLFYRLVERKMSVDEAFSK